MADLPSTGAVCIGFWSFAQHLYDKAGFAAIACLLMGYAFRQLIWTVWNAAMKSKDDELERLIEERNFLQSLVFSGREISRQKPRRESL